MRVELEYYRVMGASNSTPSSPIIVVTANSNFRERHSLPRFVTTDDGKNVGIIVSYEEEVPKEQTQQVLYLYQVI